MTVLLILVILILVTISIWQLTKIFELSQPSVKDESQIANDKDNDFQGKLMFAFLGFIYILTLFSFWKWGEVIIPVAASEHGSNFDSLMWGTFALIFFVQTVTQALVHYFSYKYRGEKTKKAFFYADNDRLEAIWTFIPMITLAVLIFFGLYTWTEIMNIEENDEALVVELYAQQFNWKARYAGEDGVLGTANVRFLNDFEGKNLVGSEIYSKLEDLSIDLYSKAAKFCENKGILLADTKFEFGFIDDQIILIDEVLTPDSSRFWPIESYTSGIIPISYDKQFVRDYLKKSSNYKRLLLA